jgi:HK97 gp10 family phage protein
MRIVGWRLPEICDEIKGKAIEAVNEVMDEHVQISKSLCPVGTITREGKFKTVTVTFTPTTKYGRRKIIPLEKRKQVSFEAQRWTGDYPGQLRDTIRRVNKPSRPGNIRVYAGNKKVHYAYFVEYGTVKMKRQSFMRPGFQTIKNKVKPKIEQMIRECPDVK